MEKTRTKFLIVALVFVSAVAGSLALASEATLRVKNLPPQFTNHKGEVVLPSDGGSSEASPSLIGSTITFSAIATDANNDDWYLAICKSNDITSRDGLPPVCDDGAWALSENPAKSGETIHLTFTTSGIDRGQKTWYAFACDALPRGSDCSKASSGADDGTGSPFVVTKPSVALRFGAECPAIVELNQLSNAERVSLNSTLDRAGIENLINEELKKSEEAPLSDTLSLASERVKVLKELGKKGEVSKAQKDAVADFILKKRNDLKKAQATGGQFCVIPTDDDSVENVTGKRFSSTRATNDHKVEREGLSLEFKNDVRRTVSVNFRQSWGVKPSLLPASKEIPAGPTLETRDSKSGKKTLVEGNQLPAPIAEPVSQGAPTIQYANPKDPNKLVSADEASKQAEAQMAEVLSAPQPSEPAGLPPPRQPLTESAPVAPSTPPSIPAPLFPQQGNEVFRTFTIAHEPPAITGAMDRMFNRLFGNASQEMTANDSEFEMRVASKDEGTQNLVAYQNLSGRLVDFYNTDAGNEIKNTTIFNFGDGDEEELYTIQDTVLHQRGDGAIEGFYSEPIDLSGAQGAEGADKGLLARAALTLAKDRAEDLFLNGGPNPDFVIPPSFVLDRDGNRIEATTTIEGETHNQLRIKFTLSTDAYPATLDPTVLITAPGLISADTSITGEAAYNNFGFSMATGDLNNDGRADLAVSAYGYNSTNIGRVYIFYNGSYKATAASADHIIQGQAASNDFGYALVAADLNNDGRTDLAASSYEYTGAGSFDGRVYVFWNDAVYNGWGTGACTNNCSAASADAIIDGEATAGGYFGYSMAVGDVNSDGRTDLAVGATRFNGGSGSFQGRVYLFHNNGNSTFGLTSCTTLCVANTAANAIFTGDATMDYFGRAIAIGNLDGDTDNDLVVGADGYSSSTGRAYIFYQDGSWPTTAGTADVIITGSATATMFGASFVIADLDADGDTDLVTSAPYPYTAWTAKTYIFYNDGSYTTGAGSADVIISAETTGTRFGQTLATGDLNADGRTDLVVGDTLYSTGRAYVFYNDGSYTTAAGSADAILTGSASTSFGGGLAVSDLNSDGAMDLAVGASSYSTSTGQTFIYLGGDRETTSNYIVDDSSSMFSRSLASGDFNADGAIDLAVGASMYSSNSGRAYIFYNDNAYPFNVAGADVTITGEDGSSFGTSLAAGDLNADGKTDLAAGASGYSGSSGRLYLFYNDGSIPTTAATADVIITGDSSSSFGGAITVGDLNYDGRSDLVSTATSYSSTLGAAYIFWNDTGGYPTTAATADVIITGDAGTYFGSSLAAGDLNADGKIDLAVSSYNYGSTQGRVYFFYNDGSIPTTAATADWTITGEASSRLGALNSLAIGDFNADSKTDLFAGAYYYSSSIGRGYIFYNDGAYPANANGGGTCTPDCADVIISGETSSQFGGSVSAADFNSDGRTDLAVGGANYGSFAGRAYIFYNDGSIPTTAATADVIITGEVANGYLGGRLASGDFNSDGHTDLAVGAVAYPSYFGRVYFYYGTGAPTANLPGTLTGEASSNFGLSMAIGDFNADGEQDLAVGAPVYSTNTGRIYLFYNDGAIATTATSADLIITGQGTSNYLGETIVAGDMNNDGRTDLISEAGGYSGTTGRAYIFLNDGTYPTSATNADYIIQGEAGTRFGPGLTVGDFNVDGRTDLAVGANYYSTNTGRAYIFYQDATYNGWGTAACTGSDASPCSAASADVIIGGEATYNEFGGALTAGDLNADGRTDLVVAAKRYNNSYQGRVYLFINNLSTYPACATTCAAATNANVIITGEAASNYFGQTLATGDLNRDGKTDLVVGAPYYNTTQGRVYLFYNDGSIPTTAATADVIITGEATNSELGWYVATGDLNGDSYPDLAAYAQNNGTFAGKAHIFYNDGAYPSSAANAEVIITGEASNNYFGSCLAIGDLNADGIGDLAVGAQQYNSWQGRTYLYYGQRQYAWTNEYPWRNYQVGHYPGDVHQIEGWTSGEKFGKSFTAGDFDGDGDKDLAVGAPSYNNNKGRIYLFLNKGGFPRTSVQADAIIEGPAPAADYTTGTALFTNGSTLVSGSATAWTAASHSTRRIKNNTNGVWYDVAYVSAAGTLYLTSAYQGATTSYEAYTLSQQPQFGFSLASGKVSNTQDLYDDLVIGTPGTNIVYVFDGRPTWNSSYTANTTTCSATSTQACRTTTYSSGVNCGFSVLAGKFAAGASLYRGRDHIAFSCPRWNGGANGIFGGIVFLAYNDGSLNASYDNYWYPADYSTTTQQMGFSLAAGDFNSDGVTDIAAGAPFYSSNAGRVHLLYMDGASHTTTSVQIAGEASSQFGYSVAAGDFSDTRDGRVDLAAGAPIYNAGGAGTDGKWYIFWNDGAYPTTAATADRTWTGDWGYGIGSAMAGGDLSRDGRDDLGVGVSAASLGEAAFTDGFIDWNSWLYYNGTGGSNFGRDSALITDLSGDGYNELIFGAQNENSDAGNVIILSFDRGRIWGQNNEILPNYSGSKFGFSATTGDFNGDGAMDLAVGSPGYDSDPATTNNNNTGRVYLFFRNQNATDRDIYNYSNADVIITGAASGEEFGYSIAAGKVSTTVDAIDDLVVGAPGASTNLGFIYIFNGRATWNASYTAASEYNNRMRESPANRCGTVVLAGVNWAGDGREDLAWSCPGSSGVPSNSYVDICPNTGSYPSDSYCSYYFNVGATNQGMSMASGDFNADGKQDLLVGDPFATTNSGAVYVYTGNGTGSFTQSNVIAGESSSKFGLTVAGGDLNQDGKDDIAVGAPTYNTNTGRAYLFWNDGSYTGSASTADKIITGPALSYFGQAVGVGDLNGDGKKDLAVLRENDPASWAVGMIDGYFNDGDYPTSSSNNDVEYLHTDGFGYSGVPGRITFGDVTKDGVKDLIWGMPCYGWNGSSCNGMGEIWTFPVSRIACEPPDVGPLTITDDNDGSPAETGYTNDATPTMSAPYTYLTGQATTVNVPTKARFSCNDTDWSSEIAMTGSTSPVSTALFNITNGATGCTTAEGYKTYFIRLGSAKCGYLPRDSYSGLTYYDITPPAITGNSVFNRVGAMTPTTATNLGPAIIDTANGYAYFGSGDSPGKIVKVRLSDFSEVGTLTLNSGENNLVNDGAVLDAVNGYAYFPTYTAPGMIVKIRLSDFTRVSAATLSSGNNYPYSGVIDTTAGYAYFGTNTSPGRIVKVDVSPSRTFQEIATISPGGSSPLETALIDSTNTYAYFSDLNWPGEVYKIQLSTFTQVGNAVFVGGEDGAVSAVLDPAGVYAYYGTHNAPAKVVRIRLSDMVRMDSVALSTNENYAYMATVDPTTSMGYFGTNDIYSTATNPGIIVKVDLSTMTRVGAVALNTGEKDFWGKAVMDSAAGYMYFPTRTNPAKVIKLQVSALSATGIDPNGISIDPSATDSGSGLHTTAYDYRRQAGASCGGATTSGYISNDPYSWGGLSPNTQHSFDVRVRDKAGNVTNAGAYSHCVSKYTLASPPAAPTVDNPSNYYEMNVTPNSGGSEKDMSIYVEEGTVCDYAGGLGYVQADGSINVGEVFQPRATWGTVTVSWFNANTRYAFCSRARNQEDVVGAYGPTAYAYTSATSPSATTWQWPEPNTMAVDENPGCPASGCAVSVYGGAFGGALDTYYLVKDCDNCYLGFNQGHLQSSPGTPLWDNTGLGYTYITGLAPNTQYFANHKYRNYDGDPTGWGGLASKYTMASQAINPSHTNTGTTSMTWSWATGGGQAGFYFSKTDSSCSDLFAVGNNFSYAEFSPPLSANTAYTRWVCAYNSDGVLNTTGALQIGPYYTDANTPAAPTVNGPTGSRINVDPVTGGVEKDMAIYVEQGATCDGSGGLGYVQPDNTFEHALGTGGKVTTDILGYADLARAVVVQSDGKIVAAGNANNGTNNDFALARYNSDGSLDTTFDTDGKVTTPIGTSNENIMAVALQSDGKIVAAGYANNGTNNDFALARYNTNGSLDTTFDTDGIVTTSFGGFNDIAFAVAIQTDGKIVTAGYANNGTNNDFALARYNTNGSLDTTFDTDGMVTTAVGSGADQAFAVALQPDGKIVTGGLTHNGVNNDSILIRYNTNGSLDSSYGSGGIVITPVTAFDDVIYSIFISPVTGKLVAGGYANNGVSDDFAVTRYTTAGVLDTTFGSGTGMVITDLSSGNDIIRSIFIQSGGKIVVAGYTYIGAGNDDFAVARYTTTGVLDTTFDTDGIAVTAIGSGIDWIYGADIQYNGKVVVAGYSAQANNDFALARYNSDGSLTTANFQSDVTWGTRTVTGFSGGTQYSFCAKARNMDNNETVFGPSASATTEGVPLFTSGPSDGGSDSTAPTLAGSAVTFTATATDPEANQYYLAVCKTGFVNPGDDAAPTCPGSAWGISTATNSGSQASVAYTTLASDAESNVWYAFVCDKFVGGGACSALSQGTGATGSPFAVDHAPTFGTVTVTDTTNGTIEPGDTLRFKLVNAQIDDTDTVGGQDTINMYICTGATTSFNYSTNTCTGGSLVCSALAQNHNSDIYCDETGNTLAPIPSPARGYNFNVYVEDSHNFPGSGINSQTFVVQDVAPTIVGYTTMQVTLTAGDRTTVGFNAQFQDNNGEGDILAGDGVIFDSAVVTNSCSAADANCYPVSPCALNTAYGTNTQAEIQCTAYVWFNANASSQWSAHVNIETEASGRITEFVDSSLFTVDALAAISAVQGAIAYGSIVLGGTSLGQTVTFQNVGNQVIDAMVSGTDMTLSTYTIPRVQQKFHESVLDFDWDNNLPVPAYPLVSTPSAGDETSGCLNRDLAVRTNHFDATADESIYFKIRIPTSQQTGTYSGTMNVASTALGTCTGASY